MRQIRCYAVRLSIVKTLSVDKIVENRSRSVELGNGRPGSKTITILTVRPTAKLIIGTRSSFGRVRLFFLSSFEKTSNRDDADSRSRVVKRSKWDGEKITWRWHKKELTTNGKPESDTQIIFRRINVFARAAQPLGEKLHCVKLYSSIFVCKAGLHKVAYELSWKIKETHLLSRKTK